MRNAVRIGPGAGTLRWLLLAIALFGSAAPRALAEQQATGPETFKARRRALAQLLGKEPILFMGAEKSETYQPFRQSNDFYYLTGVTEPDAAPAPAMPLPDVPFATLTAPAIV